MVPSHILIKRLTETVLLLVVVVLALLAWVRVM
jgi:hypothetical protein